MNNIGFDLEVVNGNTDYIYRLKQNSDDDTLINNFVHKMIINNYIKCFVPYTYEIKDKQRQFRYSFAPQIVLSDYLKNRFTDISACAQIIVNILKAIRMSEDYMIDRRFLVLNADYMLINKADNSVSLMCVPINSAEQSSLTEFMRGIIMPLNFEGLPNSDTLKVTVYQYAFDNESTDNAIEFFSKFCSAKPAEAAKAAPAAPEIQPKPAPQPQVSIPHGIPSLIKKQEAPKPADKAAAESVAAVPAQNGEKKSGIFGGLFGSSGKKADKKNDKKAAPAPSSNANPFGINIPGAAPVPEQKPKASAIPVAAVQEIKAVQPEAAPQRFAAENEDETIFEAQDEGTVFLGENGCRAHFKTNAGDIFNIVGNVFSIGRNGKAGIKIDLDLGQKTVSHLHATVYNEDGNYYIVDNNSANGTFVNNVRLRPNEKSMLTHGSRVRISNIDLIFEVE